MLGHADGANGRSPVSHERRGARMGLPRVAILAFLYGAFVAGGIYFGGLFVANISAFLGAVGGLDVPLPGVPALLGGSSEAKPTWTRKERVNILVLGVDRRAEEDLALTRTDTMMIVTIDPYGKSAGMLGLPRDLWVPIPVSDKNVPRDRINTAFLYGNLYSYPGGGPALAMKTVSYNLGIPIHYYALLDFDAFERIVDTLGGVTVEVEKTIIDYEYPTPDYGTKVLRIPAGTQHFDGARALEYARTRHADSDIHRVKRQQQVIMALRDRALQLDIIPRLPRLAAEFRDLIKTDMKVTDALALAALAKDIGTSSIASYALDYTYASSVVTPGGASVLVPDRAQLRRLVNTAFFDPRQREEAARVQVLNGTAVAGLAARTARVLEDNGWQDVSYGNPAPGQSHPATILYDLTGKPYSAQLLSRLLQLPPDRIQRRPDPEAGADIQLVIGDDLKLPQ